MKRAQQKSQSAMEYLMTYGWVILVIAVILAALFQLGVFSGTNFTGTTCLAQTDFICVSPSLTTSGSLSVSLGQVGSKITVTGLACVSGAAAPSSFSNPSPNPLVLVSDHEYSQTFTCPLPSGAPLGTQFSGYLWIQYNQGAQTALETSIAYVTAIATSAGSSGSGSSNSAYIPIILTNSGSTATPAGFQEELNIGSTNCVGCAAYEHGSLNNIEFTTAANGAGTVLDSWIETTPSNSASSVTVWVNLGSTTIAGSGGTTTIYMDMLSTNTMTGTSGVTGEAPTLSANYGQYDNGALVFNFYDNFPGTTINSEYTQIIPSGTTISQSNSVTITTGGSTYGGLILTNGFASSPTQIFDGDVTAVSGIASGFALQNGNSATSYGYGFNYWGGSIAYGSMQNGIGESRNPYLIISTGIMGGVWLSSSSQVWYEDYVATSGTQTAYTLPSTIYLSIGIYYDSSSSSITYQWIRTRYYPPGGTMPSATFGALVVG